MTIGLIAMTVIISVLAFRDNQLFNKLSFWVGPIRSGDYGRLVSSGFVHADYQHLAFNMLSLYFFGDILDISLYPFNYTLIALVSLLGGNLLSLRLHLDELNYRAVGASGMVSGLIFSAIILYPDILIGFFIIPPFLPGWIFGLLFIGISVFGMRANADNIGHDAHLGGALSGLIITILLFPQMALQHLFHVLALLIPSVILLYLSIFRPEVLKGIQRRF